MFELLKNIRFYLQDLTSYSRKKADCEIKRLQEKAVIKQLPIARLVKSDADWHALSSAVQHQKNITYPSVIDALIEIKKQSHTNIITTLQKPSLQRKAKRRCETTLQELDKKEHYLSPRAHKRAYQPNRLIFSPEGKLNIQIKHNIALTGARLAYLEPLSTIKTNDKPLLFQTPGGRKARMVCHIPGKGTLAKHLTPQASLAEVHAPLSEGPISGCRLDFANENKIKTYEMTIDKEMFLNQKKVKRGKSQTQVMGASCHTLFKDDSSPKPKYRRYHWSHLVAHFLGGPTNAKNLVPATAAANYNIFDVLECYVAKKIINDETDTVHIYAKAEYEGETQVPTQLTFTLAYANPNAEDEAFPTIEEMIPFNPRSHDRISEDELKTLRVMRTLKHAKSTIEEMDDNELDSFRDFASI